MDRENYPPDPFHERSGRVVQMLLGKGNGPTPVPIPFGCPMDVAGADVNGRSHAIAACTDDLKRFWSLAPLKASNNFIVSGIDRCH